MNTTRLSEETNIRGTMDLAIVEVKNIITGGVSGGIRVGIALKNEVRNGDWPQVRTELCTANIYSEYPVIMVLTDLRDIWIFFWLQVDGFVVDCSFSDIRSGIVVLQDIVNYFDSAERTSTDKPYSQRCDFATVLGRGGRGGIDGPCPDIMELVLGTDVANMQDVSDVMTDREINGWEVKRKVALK